MMNANCVTLNELKREILIQNLVISNSEVYDFLSESKDDPDALVHLVQKGLIIGCMGLKRMEIVGNIDYIEKEFQKFINETNTVFKKMDITNTESPFFQMRNVILEYFDKENGQLKRMLDDYFSKDDGQIKQVIDQRFDLNNKESAFSKLVDTIKANSGLDKDAIAKLLDPNNVESPSPVKSLKDELFRQFKDLQERDFKNIGDRIMEIRDHLIKEAAITDVYDKGTQKGFDFEDLVYSELERLAGGYGDIISPVGKEIGKSGKKGDIVIDIEGDEKKRIVIECKDSSINSTKAVKDDIIEAMKNRNATFGIFLFSDSENMPREYCPLKITDSYIITCGGKENLNFSYRLGRVLLSKTREVKDEIEFHKISAELRNIEEDTKNIKNLQTEVSKILNSGAYLRDNLEKLRQHIDASIDKIERYLGEKYDKKAVINRDIDFIEDDKKPKRTRKEIPSWMKEK